MAKRRKPKKANLGLAQSVDGKSATVQVGKARPAAESKWAPLVLVGLIVLATAVVYGQVHAHAFLNFDDQLYLTDNPHVQGGLTGEGVAWAFTARRASNWHPLTWLSHMADCQLFGLNPAGHHLVNVGFHLVNSVLLFLVFFRLTGRLWPCGFVAAAFALHPLHVESVAWAAERKDVLSGFFWMLTMLLYVRYVQRRGLVCYLAVAVILALGLMAKPMLVTLPFVLLLLDFWPLGRIAGFTRPQRADSLEVPRDMFSTILVEKIPLLILAAASCAVTYWVQHGGGAVQSQEAIGMGDKLANAVVTYVNYISMMFWPRGLAALYPHHGMGSIGQVAGALLLLLGVSATVIRWGRRVPYLAVGWFWYVGTLLPVIGLVQVGGQAMADRYTYIPLIGLFVALAWGIADLAGKRRWARPALIGTGGAAAVAAMTIATWIQVGHWKNTRTLFEHAMAVTERNYLAHFLVGNELAKEQRVDEAIEHYQRALEIRPREHKAHMQLGLAWSKKGDAEQAMACYRRALEINPDYVNGHINLGVSLVQTGRFDEGIGHYLKALDVQPGYALVHRNLGIAYDKKGDPDAAIAQFEETLRLLPQDYSATEHLALVHYHQRRYDEAIGYYEQAVLYRSDYAVGHSNLGAAYLMGNRLDDAVGEFRRAIGLEDDNLQAHLNLATVFMRQNRIDEAKEQYQHVLRIDPAHKMARSQLANMQRRQSGQ